VLAAVLLLATAACAQAARPAPSYPTGFSERVLVDGLQAPTAVAWAPDGRMFVATKQGDVEVAQSGSTNSTRIIDISGQVNHSGDRGLLGLAVDAEFAQNNYVYLLYTYDVDPLPGDSESSRTVARLERWTITPGNVATFDKVLLGSYVQGACPPARNDLDCIPSDDLSHSIGTVRADADGSLWVGAGDAASYGEADPLALRSYDERSMAGKIMHIDREGRGLEEHPFCPGTTDLTQVCTKIWAKGFRNPYRFQIRPGGRGLMVGDVGWNQYEELDAVSQGGGDYGWPCYEATHRTPDYRDWDECGPEYAKEGTPQAHKLPVYEYPHPVGNTVIAGPTYTGNRYPSEIGGDVFYGDYAGKTIRRVTLDDQDQVVETKDFASGWEGMVGLEQAPNGNLVGVDIGTFSEDGAIREIVYEGREPEAAASATPTSGPTPLTVDFTGSSSFDADDEQLTYDWDFGDGTAHSSAVNPRHVYQSAGTFTARLTVSDDDGHSDTATVTIRPGTTAPQASITQPADGSTYRGGEAITLKGTGEDLQDGSLPGGSLAWRVLLHHGDHVHTLTQSTGAQVTFNALEDHDADSHYEVRLTATDSSGLTGSRTITLRPETAPARITSIPSGAPVTYGGRDFTAPLSTDTAVGFKTSLTADASFTRNGRTFYFDRWSDGGNRARSAYKVPASGFDLRAYYREDKAAGRPATASTSEPGHAPGQAVDGTEATYWGSEFLDAQWWQVDLGTQRKVDQVRLAWTAAYPDSYEVQTSSDGATWSTASEVTMTRVPHGTSPGTATTTFATRTARYVRIRSGPRATEWGVAFSDARVLGPADSGTLPETSISSGPSGPTRQTSASWGFTGTAGASFECKLDGANWSACTSPKTFTGLSGGSHTFLVRAVGDAGEDPTPASRTVVVDTSTPPLVPPGGSAPTPTAPKAPPPKAKPTPKPTPKPSYSSTLMSTRGLGALFGLGDGGAGARDSTGGRAGRFHGSPRRARRLTGARGTGWARAFDGRDDWVALDPASLGRPRAFSLELWVKASPNRRTAYLLAAAADRGRDGFSLALDRRSRVVVAAARRPAQAARLLGPPLGAVPRHVVLTYDGRRLRLYVDGRLRRTGRARLTWNRARRLVLGADEDGRNRFKGILDDLSLYDRALPASTVAAHRAAGR